MFKNKKGDLSVYIFVFLSVACVFFSLYFYAISSGKIEMKILSAFYADEIYFKESLAGFYISEDFENSVVKTYFNLIEEYAFIHNEVTNEHNKREFRGFNNKVNDKFVNEAESNFLSEFSNKNFKETFLVEFVNTMNSDNLKILKNQEVLDISVSGLKIVLEKNSVNYTYKPVINRALNLSRLGLYDFKDIYNFKEECVYLGSLQEQVNCYNTKKEMLKNFEIEIEIITFEDNPDKDYILLIFKSKKKFFVSDDYKNLEFEFVPKPD